MPDDNSGDAIDLDQLLEALRARVESRRNAGMYPSGLDEELDEHFKHLVAHRPPSPSFTMDELEDVISQIQHFEFSRAKIATKSNIPGGTGVHRVIGKSVARQVQGVLEQVQDQSQRIGNALALLGEITDSLADAYDRRVVQQIDDLQVRLAEHQRELNRMRAQVSEVTARTPGVAVDAWYSAEAFTVHFRGDVADMAERYGDEARAFVGCDPVLDIGFGRGEFLELLRDLGVEASGIEVDPALVESARERGLRAETGRAVEYLSSVPDASLGGLVMIQVIEHLTPQHVVDIVKIAADKVRPGGRVMVETVNPTSLFTYAHALWVDPDHVRPVHPNYLGFLFAEAGFASVERVDRSPVPENESLELLPGEDEQTKRLNVNFERINALLFGPQDYAIVAKR